LLFCLIWVIPMTPQSADLSLEMSVDKLLVELEEIVTFTIEVSNDGPESTTGVQVSDRLPAGYEFVSARTTAGIYDQSRGIWNIDRLGNGNRVVLTIIAKVKRAIDLMNLAEIISNDLLDYDSVANNGVDTDRDGNIVDDVQDEDDGDGQFVIVGREENATKDPNPASGECLAPLDAESAFDPNPEDEINGIFKFDYKIESTVNLGMGGEVIDNSRFGNTLKMTYYVNSADGSILFPGGDTGFFKTNIVNMPGDGKVDGAIWLANGQMVSYVEDTRSGVKKAITRESAQTANGRFGADYLHMMQFFRISKEMAELPDPLPDYVNWPGSAKGYRAEMVESYTGLNNTYNIYFDTAPTPIKTTCIMMGFMVGVLKDVQNTKCNRLMIYTKVNIGALENGEFLEVILNSIKPAGITFDATTYDPAPVSGDAGTAIANATDDYEARMRSIEIRRQTIERRRCSNDRCWDQKNADLEDLRKEKSEVICTLMVDKGMANTMAECMRDEGF